MKENSSKNVNSSKNSKVNSANSVNLNANSSNSTTNSNSSVNSNTNSNFKAELKSIFALPKWAKIFLAVLSVVAVAGLITAFGLKAWATDKVESGQLVLKGISKSQASLDSGFAFDGRLYFQRLDFLLRSKVIAYIDIQGISWGKNVDKNAISDISNHNRHIKFITSQDLQGLNTQNIGKVEYKMDFSPLPKTILKYYLIISLCLLGAVFGYRLLPILQAIITTKNKKVQILLVLCVFIAMSASFYGNVFGIVSKGWFENFQLDDQSMVIAKIVADKNGIDTKGYGMGFLVAEGYDNVFGYQSNVILEKGVVPQDFRPYTSTPGLQGYVWSFVYSIFNDIELNRTQSHLKNLKPLNLICSLLSAFVILTLSFLLGKIFGKLFGVVFLLSMFLSPWVTNFAHHTFYNLWLWLIPAIFGFWIFLYLQNDTYKTHKKAVFSLIFAYFVSMFVVSLTHYHFLTSVVLFSLAPFLLVPFLAQAGFLNAEISLKTALKFFVALFALAVFSTLIVLILHGFIRGGGDLIEGFKIMYEKDFLRRMVGGNAENFNPVYAESLNASIVEVVLKYFNWTTPIIVGIKFTGNFCVLILLDFILLIYAIKNDAQRKLLAAMLMVFALPAISWFIFGKAQSYIHTHMDFVLWYFGFVAVAFYIPVLTIKKHFERT